MRRGSREFECGRQLDFGYDISQKNTQGNAVKAFRISEAPFFEPSAMYNNNQTLLDVYDIRAKEKIKKLAIAGRAENREFPFLLFFIDLIDGNLLISPRKCL
jgi:hypothetical protein